MAGYFVIGVCRRLYIKQSMKIKCALTGETIDTDKMPDVEAEVLEAMQRNVEMFCKYKIPFLMICGKAREANRNGGPVALNFNENHKDLKMIMDTINGLIITLNLPYKLFRIESKEE